MGEVHFIESRGRVDAGKASPQASAATLQIGLLDGNTVTITGTTGITSFGSARQPGQSRTLVFSGAVILTHSSSLLLPGSVNLTTAAGDVLVFVADTESIWRLVSITRADGSFVGSVSGSFDGNATLDSMQLTPQAFIADGAITSNFVTMDSTAATTDLTLASLAAGKIHVFTCLGYTSSCTITLAVGTFDGTNNTATFDAAYESLTVIGLDGTQGVILLNSGAVVMSSV